MEQHVANEDPLVRRGKVAFGTLVYLFTGVHLAHMVMEFHRVVRGKGAEAALELFASRVPLLLMLAEDVLVGTNEVTLLAVEGIVDLAMRLHHLGRGEEEGAGIVLALDRFDAMSLPDMSQEVLPVLSAVAAACLEAAQLLGLCLVGLEMLLESLAQLKRLLTHRAGIDIRIEVGDVLMHAGHVPVQGILLHRTVVTQRAAVGLLAGLAHHVDLQLAFTREELLTVWALQPWVREVEVEVFHQVSPLLEAALALWTHVGLKQTLGVPSHIGCNKKTSSLVQKNQQRGPSKMPHRYISPVSHLPRLILEK